ncbi:MAG: hypothetical protein Q9212_002174 [Teloschistes hypoglaucus]
MPADEESNEDSTLPNHAKKDEVTGDKESDGQLDGQDEAEQVDDRGLARKAADWVRAHPYQVAIQVGTVVVMVTPAAVAAPVLGVFGFGAGLGGAATAYQASHGPIVAQSIFATLQSAGAGGYGVPIVHGVFRAGSAQVSVLSAGVAVAGRKETAAKDENGPIEIEDKQNRNDNHKEEAGDPIQSNTRRNTGAPKSRL